jgi:hypothetical protein
MCSASIDGALTCGKCLHINRLIGQPDLTASATLSKNMPAGFRPPIVRCNGFAREIFGRMRWRWLRSDVAADPGHIVIGKPCVVLIAECFPTGEVVVHDVPEDELAALNDCRVVQRREVGQQGCGPGHRHFMHNGIPNKFGAACDEVQNCEPSGAASIEGGGKDPQRLDQAGDLIAKFGYRDVTWSLDAASREARCIECEHGEIVGEFESLAGRTMHSHLRQTAPTQCFGHDLAARSTSRRHQHDAQTAARPLAYLTWPALRTPFAGRRSPTICTLRSFACWSESGFAITGNQRRAQGEMHSYFPHRATRTH